MQDSSLILTYAINAIIFLLLFSWPVLSILALLRLRRLGIRGAETVLWVIVILFAPILGAIAFLMTNPSGKAPNRTEAT